MNFLLSLLEDKQTEFLDGWDKTQYKINPDHSVDMLEHIQINGQDLEALNIDYIPVKFKNSKNFTYVETSGILTSLKNSPVYVDGFYNIVAGYKLTSLVGSPEEVTGNYNVSGNYTSLEGMPKIIGNTVQLLSRKLSSLEDIGSYCESIGNELVIRPGCIKSHMLGVLKIKNLKRIGFLTDTGAYPEIVWKATKIINNHLKSNRNIRKCQAELEDAGLEEYAQL